MRHMHTCIIIVVDSAPIVWYFKLQATINYSTFGSKVISVRTYLELIKSLFYKLLMMSVPISGTEYVFRNNKVVVNDTLITECKTNKNHIVICYHAAHKYSLHGIRQVGFIKVKHNNTYFLTKILSGTAIEKQVYICLYKV